MQIKIMLCSENETNGINVINSNGLSNVKDYTANENKKIGFIQFPAVSKDEVIKNELKRENILLEKKTLTKCASDNASEITTTQSGSIYSLPVSKDEITKEETERQSKHIKNETLSKCSSDSMTVNITQQGLIDFPIILEDEEVVKKQVENKHTKIKALSELPNSDNVTKTTQHGSINPSPTLKSEAIKNEVERATYLEENIPLARYKNLNKSVSKITQPIEVDKSKKISPDKITKEEKQQQKLARLKEIEERKKKKEEERLLKHAEKEKREEEKRERERIKEIERKKREEEKRKRDEEKRKKDEEKHIKDEEKRKKDELLKIEKEKKEAERKQKEDQKRLEDEKRKNEEEACRKKKENAANRFKSFFTKKTSVSKKEEECIERFKPFQMKPDMTLAPIVRKSDINRKLIDQVLENKVLPDICTYLEELSVQLQTTKRFPYITRKRLRKEIDLQKNVAKKRKIDIEKQKCIDEDVVVIDGDDDEASSDVDEQTNIQNIFQAKYLGFSENTRPAYYGTWRKQANCISGKKPFGMDKDIFNYEIDSDEEWIDEPGENLSDNNADDDDKEEEETEDDRDGFFVPHGYLSDDEGVEASDNEDNKEETTIAMEGASTADREREKLQIKVYSFEVEFKKKVKLRKPLCIGIVYHQKEIHPVLKEYTKVSLFKPTNEKENLEDDVSNIENTKADLANDSGCRTSQTVPEEAMPLLIRLVHGSEEGIQKMIVSFKQYWLAYVEENKLDYRSNISKRQLERKIQSVATRCHSDILGKICYVVKDEVLKKYNSEDVVQGCGLAELKFNTLPQLSDQINNNKHSVTTAMDTDS